MRRSKFTEVETAHAVKQCEAGIPVREVARKYGVSQRPAPELIELDRAIQL